MSAARMMYVGRVNIRNKRIRLVIEPTPSVGGRQSGEYCCENSKVPREVE